MHVRITPQYRNGHKLTGLQMIEVPKPIGMLTMTSESGQRVVRMDQKGGGGKHYQAELFGATLTAIFGETFRLIGIERSSTGAWVHQAWHCEVRGAWRNDEVELSRPKQTAS